MNINGILSRIVILIILRITLPLYQQLVYRVVEINDVQLYSIDNRAVRGHHDVQLVHVQVVDMALDQGEGPP